MSISVICIQTTDLMNNILIVLKFGHKFVFQFFIHVKVGSFLRISSTSYKFVTNYLKNVKGSMNLLYKSKEHKPIGAGFIFCNLRQESGYQAAVYIENLVLCVPLILS